MNRLLHISLLFTAVFLMTAWATSDLPSMDFEAHFKALSTVRHPLVNNGRQWKKGRDYVKSKMAYYGLGPIIHEQEFNATVEGQEVQGVNLIGLEEGEDPSGPIIVVGADYATARQANPLKDNTGGVACLLETIHLYHDRVAYNNYFKNFTVVFVAFDLNTNEYHGSEMSHAGSYIFVNEWLLPYLNETNPEREFRGAMILDSVTTFNPYNETQVLPGGFKEVFPTAYPDITKRGNKGNFLGLLYRAMDAQNDLMKTYATMYHRDRKLRPFRLQKMEAHISTKVIEEPVLNMVNHQAHFHFWTMEKPACLLFDTDNYRMDPDPDSCTPEKCEVDEFLNGARVEFMEHATYTLVFTLLDLQTTLVEYTSAASAIPCAPLLLFIPLIVTLLKI